MAYNGTITVAMFALLTDFGIWRNESIGGLTIVSMTFVDSN